MIGGDKLSSLWGSEFELSTKSKTDLVLNKLNKKSKKFEVEKKVNISKLDRQDKIAYISAEVNRILGKYKEDTIVIYSKQELNDYIAKANKNKEIAIDTETNNSLDYMTCSLMGACLYTPGLKQAYVPVNHVDDFDNRLTNQLTEEDIKDAFGKIESSTLKIFHNGKFDLQVIYKTCGIMLKDDWDTMIASQLLDEEAPAGLKSQYISRIDSSIEKYDIESLFKKEQYAIFPPELFALYAATDSYMTYKLYKWQLAEMEKSPRLFSLFKTVEMPVLEVVTHMELDGVCIDKEYASRLSVKWHKKQDKLSKELSQELDKYVPAIELWKKTKDANIHPVSNKTARKQEDLAKGIVLDGKKYFYLEDLPKGTVLDEKLYSVKKSKLEQFQWPLNYSSPTQLAIFIYDILKAPVIDKDSPRGTGEDVLKLLDFPFCKLLLDLRSCETILNTFIDKIPEEVSEVDGKLHCHFNQLGKEEKGVRTGRFSSSDPNLQNIPSGETSIRLMFTASPGYTMIGADYSAQEPRLLAAYSKDEYLVKSLQEGKDPYATIAVGVYKNAYRDNLEFETNEDGSWKYDENGDRIKYEAGAHRRKSVKSLLLGIMYGMSTNSIAERMKLSYEDARKILNDFFNGFPGIKTWMDESLNDARQFGYVEDFWGRRRHLKDLSLPKFTVKSKTHKDEFNPLLNTSGINYSKESMLADSYSQKLCEANGKKEIESITKEAQSKGLIVTNNGAFIARAERQCVNARIQGGAASMTKRAMNLIYRDSDMRRLGFRLLLTVHDELIGECPSENVAEAKDRLSYLMQEAAKPEVAIRMKSDSIAFPCWYYDELSAEIREEYESLLSKGYSKENSIIKIKEEYEEMLEYQIDSILSF